MSPFWFRFGEDTTLSPVLTHLRALGRRDHRRAIPFGLASAAALVGSLAPRRSRSSGRSRGWFHGSAPARAPQGRPPAHQGALSPLLTPAFICRSCRGRSVRPRRRPPAGAGSAGPNGLSGRAFRKDQRRALTRGLAPLPPFLTAPVSSPLPVACRPCPLPYPNDVQTARSAMPCVARRVGCSASSTAPTSTSRASGSSGPTSRAYPWPCSRTTTGAWWRGARR